MTPNHDLWRAARWPALLLLVAGVALLAATILDRTTAREWALTIGAPALTIALPVGALWLIAVIAIHRKGRRDTP